MDRCPGIRSLTQPSIIIRSCPSCGGDVEFFEYETETKCPECDKLMHKEATSSCVTWCQYASKCIDDLKNRKIILPAAADELEKIAKTKNGGY